MIDKIWKRAVADTHPIPRPGAASFKRLLDGTPDRPGFIGTPELNNYRCTQPAHGCGVASISSAKTSIASESSHTGGVTVTKRPRRYATRPDDSGPRGNGCANVDVASEERDGIGRQQ